MDDENERPGLFNMWPSVTFINCPKCGTHWVEPRFGSEEAFFPPFDSTCDEREPIQRGHCPRCGDLLPTIDASMHSNTDLVSAPIFNWSDDGKELLSLGMGRVWDVEKQRVSLIVLLNSGGEYFSFANDGRILHGDVPTLSREFLYRVVNENDQIEYLRYLDIQQREFVDDD